MKWQWRLPVVVAAVGLPCGGMVLADGGSTAPADQAAYVETAFYQAEQDATPFHEEPDVAPMPEDTGASPPGATGPSPLPAHEGYNSPSDVSFGPEAQDAVGRAWIQDTSGEGTRRTWRRQSCRCRPTFCGRARLPGLGTGQLERRSSRRRCPHGDS